MLLEEVNCFANIVYSMDVAYIALGSSHYIAYCGQERLKFEEMKRKFLEYIICDVQ